MEKEQNTICLITGANSGIGKVTALELAKKGMTIVMVCRNKEKGEQARGEIIAGSGNNNIELFLCDLAKLDDVERLAREVRNRYNRLDILINNAGLIIEDRQTTAEGFEMTFAINHLGHFLLTHLLLDLLKKSDEARIINVSSTAHKYAKLDFTDLQLEKNFSAIVAYSNSKLANILFTRQLANEVASFGITVNSLHPGFINTNFGSGLDKPLFKFLMFIASPLTITSEEGAQTSIYLASSPEVKGKSGLYFVKKRPQRPSKEALSDYNAKQLWEISHQLTDLDERLVRVRQEVKKESASQSSSSA